MIKLITLDLDGTLMSPDHMTVSNANRTALLNAHNNGVKIAISTGRTLAIMGDVCEQVPQVDYIMYSNGAGVVERGSNKLIYTNQIPWVHGEQIINYLNTKRCFYEIYVDGKSYVQQDKSKYFGNDALPQEFIDKLLKSMCVCQDAKAEIYGCNIEKMTIYCKYPDEYNELWQHFKNDGNLYLASSLPGSMEVTKIGVDKGTALQGMCNALNILPSEVMAFGDAGNDCPMLNYAECSFAMENGTEECKNSAKYITKSNAQDGVAHAINKYVL